MVHLPGKEGTGRGRHGQLGRSLDLLSQSTSKLCTAQKKTTTADIHLERSSSHQFLILVERVDEDFSQQSCLGRKVNASRAEELGASSCCSAKPVYFGGKLISSLLLMHLFPEACFIHFPGSCSSSNCVGLHNGEVWANCFGLSSKLTSLEGRRPTDRDATTPVHHNVSSAIKRELDSDWHIYCRIRENP